MPTTKTEWFLIANASRASVVAREDRRRLHVVATFEPRTDAHRREYRRFAHELAEFLEQQAASGVFDELSIFAADPFLGELKGELGHGTQRRLAAARPVDLSAVGPAELEVRIGDALATQGE